MNIIYILAFFLLFQFLFAGDQALQLQQSSTLPACKQIQKVEKATTADLIFKSSDGGQTWQDISKGLPENLEQAGFFANESGLYLQAENGLYQSNPNSPFWKKDVLFPGKPGSIAPAKEGIIAYNFDGQFLQQKKGTNAWVPVYTNFEGNEVRTVFETAGGTVFIASNNQLFKSTNGGKTWKPLRTGGSVTKIVESNGVLLATGGEGILRSTDDGENWKWVIREGGVGIAVECIKAGFAAITYNEQSRTRRVRASYDAGNTWQPIDAGLQDQVAFNSVWLPINASNPAQSSGLPVQAFITSIIQVGENFFCGYPTGIFKSSDKGRTWKLMLPSVKAKFFNLYVSGNVIYAIPRNEGC